MKSLRNGKHWLVAWCLLSAIAGIAAAEQKGNISFPKDFRAWMHVKSMVIFEKSHGLYGFHNVYANPASLQTLKSGGTYPEGSMLIAAFYEPVKDEVSFSQGKPLKYVVMKKDSRFKDTGGWAYEAWSADEMKPLVGDKAKEKCHNCHMAVMDADFVYSKFID